MERENGGEAIYAGAAALMAREGGAFAAVWVAAADAMALSDPEGIVLLANPAYYELYGYTPQEVLGRSFALIFPEGEREQARAQYRAVFQGPAAGPPFESVVRRGDGSERVVESRYTFLVRDGRREAMLSIVRDITEQKRLEAELRAAVSARDGFLAVAAHELRNPLTAIKGFAWMLVQQFARPEWDRDRVIAQARRLQERIGHLEALVDDLFDVAQLERGHLDLHPERVELVTLVRDVLAACEDARERTAGHTLVLAEDGPLWLEADPHRLEQVVTNLVANALKYSPDGGEVRCAVGRDGAWAVLAVRDRGIGIPLAEQGALFRPFARVADPAHAIRGLGLGLYITRTLVERHGGTIALRSAPGEGTEVTVRLPLPAPDRED